MRNPPDYNEAVSAYRKALRRVLVFCVVVLVLALWV